MGKTKGVAEIILKAVFGDKTREVIIKQPSGANGIWHINIDGYYMGQVVPDLKEGWRVALQNEGRPEWMTEDDKAVIVEAVKNKIG